MLLFLTRGCTSAGIRAAAICTCLLPIPAVCIPLWADLTSPNCRRELVEALRLQKPLLVVRETDANHGAVTQNELRDEVNRVDLDDAERQACYQLIDHVFPAAVEWYREAHLKHAALSEIVSALFQHTNGEEHVVRVVPRNSVKGPPCAGVYVSEQYPQHVCQQLSEAFGVPLLQQRQPGTATVLLLYPGVFDKPSLVEELCSMITTAPLVALYSTELPFVAYMQRCPHHLDDMGLFKIMFGKWPRSGRLRKVAAEHALSKLSEKPAGSSWDAVRSAGSSWDVVRSAVMRRGRSNLVVVRNEGVAQPRLSEGAETARGPLLRVRRPSVQMVQPHDHELLSREV